MRVLDRLRGWWRRRSWTGGDAGAADGSVADYECAVCGTGVDDPGEPCPLCRSTDRREAGTTADEDADADDDPVATGAAGVRHVAAGDDASIDRLRELREDGELLQRYADRWTSVDGGFRIETSDGTRVVESREEVAALLRAEDG